MKVFVTYCSRDKDASSKLLPAIQRYDSDRIRMICQKAKSENVPFLILSGSPDYDLLCPDDQTKYYDHLLECNEVEAKAGRVSQQLKHKGVTEVVFYRKEGDTKIIAPYTKTMELACEKSSVKLDVRDLSMS